MTSNNQRRLLLLLKLLYEQTDETHFVSGADILRYWEDAGIRANRKNVYGRMCTEMSSSCWTPATILSA